MVCLKKFGIVVLTLLVLCFDVFAFGIVMPYWEGRPLVMHPGESKDVVLELQNVAEDDITVEVRMTKGSEIASIVDKSSVYEVPKGSTSIPINLKVSIPPNTTLGSSYEISISIKDVSPKGGGMVQLTTSIDKAFTVIVEPETPAPAAVKEEKPAKQERNLLLPVVIVLVLLFAVSLIAVYIQTKKKSKPVKRKGKSKV